MLNKHVEAIKTISQSIRRLQGYIFPTSVLDPFLNYISVANWRIQSGETRPLIIGFIGCTSTGKSTVFNSLAGREISATGWQAHHTSGPVLLTHPMFLDELRRRENDNGTLLLPAFERVIRYLDPHTPPQVSEEAETLQVILMEDDLWKTRLLVDLPDINTTLAKDEKSIAQKVLPWLDVVIFLVDDETLYHREYETPAADAREFRQRVLCVLNNRGRDRVELDHPDLKGVVSFFGAEKLHVLPKLTGKRIFQREPEFISLLDALFREKEPAGIKPLLKKTVPLAQALVEENRRRKTALLRMERKITDTIEDRIQKDAAVSFKDVLNDEVFTALDHLGLKRFAITNFWTFIKRVGNTWSFKQSFQAAFGSNRHQTLSQMLTINTDKLEDEVRSRISDHTEELRRLLHRQEESAILIQANPDFKTLAFIKAMPLQTMLQEIAREFETEIRDTLSEDKLAAALKNDPILVLSVLGVFLVDMLTIPGFFSWLGVPTLFKFLPIGKFDKMKRRFQQSIRDLIREALMQTVIQIKNSRSQLILEDQDPIYHALTICTEDHEY